ncbi:MAG: DHH family phosphoesterase [Candidatus Magasanikiibacteriota bacterium]
MQSSSSVHIVTHLNPDYDAYASITFMFALLKKNFPNKKITMSVETESINDLLDFLPHLKEISLMPLVKALEAEKPDFLIIVDASSIPRVSKNPDLVRSLITNCKTAMFDHHPLEETNFDIFENHNRYAAVEVIYSYALKQGLALPEKWEEYYLTGFIGDSYRFYYQYPSYRESFEAISIILDHGYTIREYSDKLYGYTPKDLTVFKLLLNHLTYKDKYSITYITWEEYFAEIDNKLSESEFKKARRYFIDEIMTKTYSVDFAVFIVPDDTYKDGKTYSGSIRSKDGTIDCTIIARYLNGGGHTTGSGFTVVASSMTEALEITQKILAEHSEEARIQKSIL